MSIFLKTLETNKVRAGGWVFEPYSAVDDGGEIVGRFWMETRVNGSASSICAAVTETELRQIAAACIKTAERLETLREQEAA